MLKRPIKYTDFNGKEVIEDFYFNLTQTELIELGLNETDTLTKAVASFEAGNASGVVNEFKKIILAAYGVKSPDGRRFIKTAELREEFSQTAAYSALFMDIAIRDGAVDEFLQGVFPTDWQQIKAQEPAKPWTAEVAKPTPTLEEMVSMPRHELDALRKAAGPTTMPLPPNGPMSEG